MWLFSLTTYPLLETCGSLVKRKNHKTREGWGFGVFCTEDTGTEWRNKQSKQRTLPGLGEQTCRRTSGFLPKWLCLYQAGETGRAVGPRAPSRSPDLKERGPSTQAQPSTQCEWGHCFQRCSNPKSPGPRLYLR